MPAPTTTGTAAATGTPGLGAGRAGIDPRGPRVAAGLTTVVLAVVLLAAPAAWAVALLAAQMAVFERNAA